MTALVNGGMSMTGNESNLFVFQQQENEERDENENDASTVTGTMRIRLCEDDNLSFLRTAKYCFRNKSYHVNMNIQLESTRFDTYVRCSKCSFPSRLIKEIRRAMTRRERDWTQSITDRQSQRDRSTG